MVALRQLIADASALGGSGLRLGGHADPDIQGIVHRADAVTPGALFCCVRGSRVDGHDLAPAALEAGAAALVVDHELDLPDGSGGRVPQVVVTDVRSVMGPLAAAFWGVPSRRMSVVGITGTAGKTTVTHLVQAVLNAADRSCGVIGTLSGARTTPEAPDLQAELAAAHDAGRVAMALEVSSHGLELHRVDGTWFDVAAFTNLSHDHLDFHPTMDDYFTAKARLFTPDFCRRAVICTDDEWGRRLVSRLAGTPIDVIPYSVADAHGLHLGPDGARFLWRGVPMSVKLAGRFNVANAVAAATVAETMGVGREAIAAGLRSAGPAPGRFEAVAVGQPFTVLVDYAHKPEALEQALRAARDLAAQASSPGQLTVVFGCGGDRDRVKRPLMGAVAGGLADQVIVTTDNPRSEDPKAIAAEVLDGIPAGVSTEVELDRRRAIGLALEAAAPGDVVLIAGKGHETTQTIADQVLPFDDRIVARDILTGAGWSNGKEAT